MKKNTTLMYTGGHSPLYMSSEVAEDVVRWIEATFDDGVLSWTEQADRGYIVVVRDIASGGELTIFTEDDLEDVLSIIVKDRERPTYQRRCDIFQINRLRRHRDRLNDRLAAINADLDEHVERVRRNHGSHDSEAA